MSNLPTFLIIGALKSGTTSLFEYITQHPEVYGSPVKEPRYFLSQHLAPSQLARLEPLAPPPVTNRDDYERLFTPGNHYPVRGEASASYLYDRGAAARVRELLPDVKLIAILRDPVERAWSSYLHVRRDGGEPHADIRDALAAEPDRIRAGWPAIYHYVRAGRYAQHLTNYLGHFPRKQLLVLFYEDLRDRPATLLRDVFRHLEVDEDVQPDTTAVYNRGGNPRSSAVHRLLNSPPPRLRQVARRLMPDRTRRAVYLTAHQANLQRSADPPPDMVRRVREELLEDVAALEEMTGRDLTTWKGATEAGTREQRVKE